MDLRTSMKRLAMVPVRAWRMSRQPLRNCARFIVWLVQSREHTNLTYHISEQSRAYMASAVAIVVGRSESEILSYFEELERDQALASHLRQAVKSSERAFIADEEARYGRRLGWYALVRALRPSIVIETGVDKGLGVCVIASALMRNAEEGSGGRYFGTDINPRAGYLFKRPYAGFGEILYGDSIETLSSFDQPIDLFINDSDHSKDYEYQEYITIAQNLTPTAVLVGDNAHVSDSLHRFSVETGRRFLFIKEEPRDHWYPGGGMGLSFRWQ